MPSNYWAERARKDKIKVIKTGENGINELKRLLKTNLDDVDKKIKNFYDKYGDNPAENLSYKDFLKYKADLKKKAQEFPEDKILQKMAKQDIPKYRIDRLRALQADLQIQLAEATKAQEQGIYKTLNDVGKVAQATTAKRYKDIFNLTFDTIAKNKMQKILSSDWSGADWSERLWKDREKVGKKVTKILEKGVTQGTSLQTMARELKQATGQSFNDAFRLIRTETSHIDGQVTLEGYKQAQAELGFEYYVYDAFLDSRTSKICQDLNGKKFKINEAEVGVNYPPMHPNCRSTTTIDMESTVADKKEEKQKNNHNLNSFVDGVINNNLNPVINEIEVGKVYSNVQAFLTKQNIKLPNKEIKLTYRKVKHSLRDNKNPLQKVTPDQLKRIDKIIKENNAYFDTVKNNLIYIGKLPKSEIENGRDIIKIPVNIAFKKKRQNIVGTVSRVSFSSLNGKQYKKID